MVARHGAALYAAEWFFTILFTIEYLLRLWTARDRLAYARSFYGVVDLLSVLPTWLSIVFPPGRFLVVLRVLDVATNQPVKGAKVLAGGQSLLPLLSMRLAAPTTLVDINRVPGLDTVEATGDGVTVGALVRHNALLGGDPQAMAAARVQPLLARATANVAHPAIRNRGTTVGSIAHADPSGEMTSVLALTDGSVTVTTPDGVETIGWRIAQNGVGQVES